MIRPNDSPSRRFGQDFSFWALCAQLGLGVLLCAGCGDPAAPVPVIAVAPPTPSAPIPPSPLPRVVGDFLLKAVNNGPLPAKCPYGTGEWDYDADAGTWQVIESTFRMNPGGTYSNTMSDRAKSGATLSHTYSSTYTRISESTFEVQLGDVKTVATITGNRLIWDWGNGTTLTFEQ
jgi:hypothetical protein